MFAGDTLRLAEILVTECTKRSLKIATVESCTGGLIAGAITSISGASQVLDRGYVTYSNAAKTELVGVPAGYFVPGNVGAVSEEAALACAEARALNVRVGVRERARVDACAPAEERVERAHDHLRVPSREPARRHREVGEQPLRVRRGAIAETCHNARGVFVGETVEAEERDDEVAVARERGGADVCAQKQHARVIGQIGRAHV